MTITAGLQEKVYFLSSHILLPVVVIPRKILKGFGLTTMLVYIPCRNETAKFKP